VCAEPSAYTSVGTVWLPPLTCSTTNGGVLVLLDVDHRRRGCPRGRAGSSSGGSSRTTVVLYMVNGAVGVPSRLGCDDRSNHHAARSPFPCDRNDLLTGLDPEQRQVAEALRGPVRVLAGAGTGKTRAITHRIAHGVATGVYQPTEVLAVTFTTRAAGEMRTRLRALGAPASRRARSTRRRCASCATSGPTSTAPTCPAHRVQARPDRRRRRRKQRLGADQGAAARPRLEIEWAKVSNVRPDDYAASRPHAAARSTALDPATVARVFGSYEEVKREQGRMDMEDVLLLTAALLADDERVAAQVRRQYKWFVVDEFQDVSPLQSALLDLWLGGRDELCVVGDPAQTIYSSPAPTPTTCATSRKKSPAPRRSSWSATTAPPPRSSRPPTAARRHALARASSCAPSARPAPPSATRARRRGRRGRGGRRRDREARRPRCAGRRDRGAVPHQRPVRGLRGRARRARHPLRRPRRGPVLRPPEVREAITLLRGTARSGGRPRRPDRRSCAPRSPAWAGPRAADRARQTRDRWESLQALVDPGRELRRRAPGGPTRRLRRRPRPPRRRAARPGRGGVTLATIHAAKGLEWDAVFVCGVQEGSLPITFAETPGRGRGGAPAALRRHDPRPPAPRGSPGPRRATRAAARPQAVALPRRAPSGRLVELPRGRATRSRGRAAAAPAASRCRPAGEKKVGRCEDCPAAYDEALFERLKAWRLERAGEEKVPAYVVFTDKTLELIAEHRPGQPRGAAADQRHRGEEGRAVRRGRARSRRPGSRDRPAIWQDSSTFVIKSFAPYMRTQLRSSHGDRN
jgi:DNA helicase-2/ATP-dependent DNA helicase PcrA